MSNQAADAVMADEPTEILDDVLQDIGGSSFNAWIAWTKSFNPEVSSDSDAS